MINSLFKDSHITQPLRHPNFCGLQSREKCRDKSIEHRREYHSVAQNSNQGIIVNTPAEINFSGLSSANVKTAEQAHWIYTNKNVKKFFHMAESTPAVFSSLFALMLTCTLRPAAIMATPSSKKNVDDKKYASAHSIASGVIAYILSLGLLQPLANAMNKIKKSPEEFMKTSKAEYLKDTDAFKAAKKYVSLFPETLIAAPRATATIALIPVILKYGFGLEKKKNGDSKDIGTPLDNYALINFKSTGFQNTKSLQNFMGGNI